MFISLIVLGVVFLALLIFLQRQNVWKDLPKGPNGLPFLGNLLELGSNPHVKLSRWATSFGPYYTLNLAGKPLLVVNSAKAIKSLFGNMASTGKYEFELLELVYSKNMGILSSEGGNWLEHKKFTRKTLKSFGLSGGPQIDNMLLDGCHELCEWIDKSLAKGETKLYFGKEFLKLTSSTIWNIITGESGISQDSTELVRLLEEYIATFNAASILLFMPWLKHVAPKMTGYSANVHATKNLHDFVKCFISKRREVRALALGKHVSKGLLDAYLDQVESCKNERDSVFCGEKGMEEIFFALIGFIIAASETTAATLSWMVFYLVAYPDVQVKLREEVDRVVGRTGNPTLSEKHRMPYLESVVYEVLRITSLVPLGVLHKLLEPVTYEGYDLPKDLILLANLYHANHDSEVWKDPNTFRPERFMEGDDEQKKQLRECVMSFQEGKRKCPGLYVAKDELFMVMAKLVQKYTFAAEPGQDKNQYTTPVIGYLLVPPKLKVMVTAREKQ